MSLLTPNDRSDCDGAHPEPATLWARVAAQAAWIARAFSWFVFRADIQVAECLATLDCVWWILMILRPGNLFDSNNAFTAMAAVFAEWQWLAISFSILLLPIGALASGGNVRLRRAALMGWVWYYSVIAYGVTQSAGLTTGTGMYGLVALSSAWGYWRLGVRRRA